MLGFILAILLYRKRLIFTVNGSRGFNGGDLTIRAERRGFIFEPDAYRLYDLDRSRYDLDFTVTGFIDDFTYTDTGWPSGGDMDGQYNYLAGTNEYQIRINTSGYIFMPSAPLAISRDYTVKARVYFNTSSNNDYYGLVFNQAIGSSYYYVFRINPDAQTYQLKKIDGITNPVLHETFTANNAIFRSAANLLKVEQNGSTLSLSVNGALLHSRNISGDNHPYSSYLSVGLYAWRTGATTTDCRFDDFELYSAVIADTAMLKARGLNGANSTYKDMEKLSQ